MAKQFDPSRLPQPPKQTFPVEIVPPSQPTLGGNWSSDSPDFKAAFLKFMQEAGEALGKAAAAEIEKVKLSVEYGDRPKGEGVTGKQVKNPAENYAVNQFMKGAGLGRSAAGMKAFATGGLAFGLGGLAAFIADTPRRAGELAESQRHFARVSPAIAGVFAQSDIRGTQRDLVSGQNIAPSAQRMLRELDKFRDSFAQINDNLIEFKNIVETKILEGINAIAGPLIESITGKRKTAEGLPFVNKLQMLADDERDEKNRNAWKAPPLNVPQGMNIGWQNGRMQWVPKPGFIGPPPAGPDP